ncbi:MAG: FadR/GntR family transcriptional regulator [Rubrobacteraceae bacterium]
MFKAVHDHSSLSEKIIAQITDAVIGGQIMPGSRLPPERDLAEQFGVSRTVVRDAIKTLAGRGFLQVRHGSGIFVATAEESMAGCLEVLSDTLVLQGSGLQDLFDVRKTLEVRTAELAAKLRTPDQVERLRTLVEEAYEHLDDPKVLSKRDAQFHVAIAEASQNLVMVRVMLTLLDLLAKSRLESLSIPGQAKRALSDHENIIKAIESQDQSQAKRAILDHLNQTEDAILTMREQADIAPNSLD